MIENQNVSLQVLHGLSRPDLIVGLDLDLGRCHEMENLNLGSRIF